MLYADIAMSFLRGSTYALYSSLSIGLPNWSTLINGLSVATFSSLTVSTEPAFSLPIISANVSLNSCCACSVSKSPCDTILHMWKPLPKVRLTYFPFLSSAPISFRTEWNVLRGYGRVVPRFTYNSCPLWFSIPPHSSTSAAKLSGSKVGYTVEFCALLVALTFCLSQLLKTRQRFIAGSFK